MKNAFRLAAFFLLCFEFANLVHSLRFVPDYTWFGLLTTLLFVFALLEIANWFFRKKCKVELHWTNWAIMFAAIAFDALGDTFRLYSRFDWYDQLGHMLGAAAAMTVLADVVAALAKAENVRIPYSARLLIAYGVASMLGTLYEIEEYLEDYFRGSKRLGDGPDTANDLMMNLIGATIALVVLWLRRRPLVSDRKK